MLSRVADLKRHIMNKYGMPKEKFEVVKIGPRIWIYLVTKQSTMGRALLYTGALITVESSSHLKRHLEGNIEKALRKYEYLNEAEDE